jgi:hypothetical protein
MFVMQTATAALTALTFTGTALPAKAADLLLVFVCIFTSCFAFRYAALATFNSLNAQRTIWR